MSNFAKRWQPLLLLFTLVASLSLAWGKLDTTVVRLERDILTQNEMRSEIILELRGIRDEIAGLRIDVAVNNQRMIDHIIADTGE